LRADEASPVSSFFQNRMPEWEARRADVWVPTVFTKNRDRLLAGNFAEGFFNAVLALPNEHARLSHDHFTVGRTLLDTSASHNSFRPKNDPVLPPSDDDGPGCAGRTSSRNFRGETRSNASPESATDPDARLTRKSHHGAIIVGYQVSAFMESGRDLIVQKEVSPNPHRHGTKTSKRRTPRRCP
jgi:hypothetical protein